jgi:protein-S-isoprenylcysteine O-methyltransferase Ste14
MKATTVEFRNRSWIITGIFLLAFSVYALGDENLALALLGWLKRWPAISPVVAVHTIFGLGALLALLCALIRTWAAAYLDTRVVHDQRLHATRLVADGPYRHVRNPLYLGSLLLAFGFAPMASRFGALVLVVGITAFLLRLIEREEQELLASQGQLFRDYCDAVPALLPSPTPRVPASGGRPRWLQGFAGEAMMWGFFVALAGFAVTLSPRVLRVATSFALLSSLVVKATVWRRPATAGPGPTA